jgi:hypothetical protein
MSLVNKILTTEFEAFKYYGNFAEHSVGKLHCCRSWPQIQIHNELNLTSWTAPNAEHPGRKQTIDKDTAVDLAHGPEAPLDIDKDREVDRHDMKDRATTADGITEADETGTGRTHAHALGRGNVQRSMKDFHAGK